jgi:hypothetical protein
MLMHYRGCWFLVDRAFQHDEGTDTTVELDGYYCLVSVDKEIVPAVHTQEGIFWLGAIKDGDGEPIVFATAHEAFKAGFSYWDRASTLM